VVGYGALGAVGGAFPISNFHLVAFGNGDGVLEILVGVVGLYFDPYMVFIWRWLLALI